MGKLRLCFVGIAGVAVGGANKPTLTRTCRFYTCVIIISYCMKGLRDSPLPPRHLLILLKEG